MKPQNSPISSPDKKPSKSWYQNIFISPSTWFVSSSRSLPAFIRRHHFISSGDILEFLWPWRPSFLLYGMRSSHGWASGDSENNTSRDSASAHYLLKRSSFLFVYPMRACSHTSRFSTLLKETSCSPTRNWSRRRLSWRCLYRGCIILISYIRPWRSFHWRSFLLFRC